MGTLSCKGIVKRFMVWVKENGVVIRIDRLGGAVQEASAEALVRCE